ncbi:MAG TPA: HEAT repeat domain-containing protein [Thermoanaerobaculia bacterium]|nr:HEAT repeat domain-containing protein [Thermoanaerobaculia bacterium]
MGDCESMRESIPLLLTESLDPASRERTHLHIEACASCSAEWSGYKDAWRMMGELPELEVPARVKQRFLQQIQPAAAPAGHGNVVPFHRRTATRWLSQAAAVVLIAGGAFYAGHLVQTPNAPMTAQLPQTPAVVSSIQPAKFSLAETRVLPADAVNPDFEGRPNIDNVQFVDADPRDGKIGVSFDMTSHLTVTGSPNDKSMVRLLAYVLESQDKISPTRSRALDWVRETYSDPQNANPEIASALAKVLRSEEHEGVRIKAVDTLKTMPQKMASSTRDALIAALKNDPNPAVRIKAVEALATMARNGEQLDAQTVDTLRQKASEDTENLYVRVKAAEVLSSIKP